jgi:hypothetical protein
MFEVLDVLFGGLEASTVALKSFWRLKQFLEPIQPQLFISVRIRIQGTQPMQIRIQMNNVLCVGNMSKNIPK